MQPRSIVTPLLAVAATVALLARSSRALSLQKAEAKVDGDGASVSVADAISASVNEIPDEPISKESGAPLAVPRSAQSGKEGRSRETSSEVAADNSCVNGNLTGTGGGRCDCANGRAESTLCLSEDCILAAATVLSSLDRSADPCEDFYQFACGGWIQKSVAANSDSFTAVDARNQNSVDRVLKEMPSSRGDRADQSAYTKARRFYHSCLEVDGLGSPASSGSDKERENLSKLQALVAHAGGWDISGNLDPSVSFEERVRVVQNELGLSVFFNWGVIEHNGTYSVAVIAGGWNEALVLVDDYKDEYLKLMSMYAILLAQSVEDPIVSDIEYAYDAAEANGTNELSGHAEYEMGDRNGGGGGGESSSSSSSAALLAAESAIDLNGLMSVFNPLNWFKDNVGFTDDGNDTVGGAADSGVHDDDDEDVRKIQIDEKVAKDDVGEVGPAIEIKLELPARNSASAVDDDDEEDEGEEEVIRIESIEVTTLDPNEVEEMKASSGMRHASAGETVDYQSDDDDVGAQRRRSGGVPEDESISDILKRNKIVEATMADVMALEQALAAVTEEPVDAYKLRRHTVGEMRRRFPFMDWEKFFSGAFDGVAGEGADRRIKDITTVEVLVQEDFLVGVNELILSTAKTNPAVLTNYIIWRVLAAFYPDRPADSSARRERCLKETEGFFAPAVTSLFIRSKGIANSEKAVEQVDMMVDVMKKAFKENLESLTWLSPSSLKSAGAKLDTMVDLIGYPKLVLNTTWLDSVYSDVEVSDDDYLMNLVKYRVFMRKAELLQFFTPYSRGLWNGFEHISSVATVNAYYNQASNTMVVPIGMLQPPLFWNRPKSLTFGAFGIVVAHEITHAFDDVGIQYDEFGRFSPLYDNQTVADFHENSDCVRKQYSSFRVAPAVSVDGNVTLGENIADQGGLRIAEIAYEKWLQSHAETAHSLPALEFTHRQLFYLGYALPWCATHTDAMMRNHIIRDEHAPDKFRVVGPLANSRGFAEAWTCPSGSGMNPVEKCDMW